MAEDKIDRILNGVIAIFEKLNKMPPPLPPASQTVNKRPNPTSFYSLKGGQIQVCVGSPIWETSKAKASVETVKKEGAVFLEAAPPSATNPGKLDWENKKIVFAMSDIDIAATVSGLRLRNPNVKDKPIVSLVHVTEKDGDKSFRISFGNVNQKGAQTYFMELIDSNKNKVSINVLDADLLRLELYLVSALPKILGWDAV